MLKYCQIFYLIMFSPLQQEDIHRFLECLHRHYRRCQECRVQGWWPLRLTGLWVAIRRLRQMPDHSHRLNTRNISKHNHRDQTGLPLELGKDFRRLHLPRNSSRFLQGPQVPLARSGQAWRRHHPLKNINEGLSSALRDHYRLASLIIFVKIAKIDNFLFVNKSFCLFLLITTLIELLFFIVSVYHHHFFTVIRKMRVFLCKIYCVCEINDNLWISKSYTWASPFFPPQVYYNCLIGWNRLSIALWYILGWLDKYTLGSFATSTHNVRE